MRCHRAGLAMLTGRAMGGFLAGILLVVPTSAGRAGDEVRLDWIAARLKAAYPAWIAGRKGLDLQWVDGFLQPIDDGRTGKSDAEAIASADIKDMFRWTYPAGARLAAPVGAADPGRARNDDFFKRMYGDCRTGGVERHLVTVIWLPKKAGQRLKVTKVNGVAGRLAEVSRELDRLPAKFDRFLVPSAGTYNCRVIAGTRSPSAHSYGIAIDIAIKHSDYWRWARKGKSAALSWRNSIPVEIVEIFERHGFIWGGRWHHFDTMHFEYRPELIGVRGS
ncbi:MAG: M15 family metallopeptidase [Hyphomicrobiaceae bacterium]